ncbi:hypothetical protein [Gordonia terrae]|uniref:Uncharacterized protein n=1 Tax=Gordonia terrae NBRC 100016 TaxID=1089454 RepID=A0ABQ0HI47_9ACTN|nr:hypothetical protein [Gordonia terrae]GAB45559.1 hypothetical protein GOTRE_125_01970 [Gordonia terrae NBRC 100016]VTR08088.1 Uncharacterised protein [Clostridioides difficile]
MGRYNETLVEITPSYGGHWETFAQDGPAQGWVNGITDEMRKAIVGSWASWVHEKLPRKSIESLKKEGFGAADAKKATGVFHSLTVDALNEFGQFMNDWENNFYRIPMQSSVTMLPKDELGLLAESLVNITSTRQRMSVHQQNTVGGAIDVALISIGDGFIWLNRKHYFDNTLNPTWHLTHGATIKTT